MPLYLEPGKYLGKIVEVTFWDHVWGDEKELTECRVFGKLIEQTWQKLVVQVWETNKSQTDNPEYAVVAASTVLRIRSMKYDEEN